ncbi:type II secretion system protein [Sulfurimonas sp.]
MIKMRNGFSFVEVLVSVAILSFMGLGLLKFNAFNKRAMERNILKQENILITNSMLFEKEIEDGRTIELKDIMSFTNLNDDDRIFLESIELRANKTLEDKLVLGYTGEEELSIEYGYIALTYKDFTQNYIWAQKEENIE